MHIVDLGVSAHFIGSVLHTLLYDGPLAGTLAEKEAILWQRLRQLYHEIGTPTRLTNFSRALWCEVDSPHTSYPCMKTKASENRHLLKPIWRLCIEFGQDTPRDKARTHCALQLLRLQEIFDRSGWFLPHSDWELAMECYWAFANNYQRLAAHASANGSLCWHVVNKHHMLAHMVLGSRYLNPNVTWTFPFEDMMGRMKRVAMASKDGANMVQLSKNIFLKYRRVLYMNWKRLEGA